MTKARSGTNIFTIEGTVGGKEEKKVWVFDQWDSQNSGRVKFATTFATPSPAFFVNA